MSSEELKRKKMISGTEIHQSEVDGYPECGLLLWTTCRSGGSSLEDFEQLERGYGGIAIRGSVLSRPPGFSS